MILPKVLPEGVQYHLIKHEGKQDLEKSLPRKLRAITHDARFIVVRGMRGYTYLAPGSIIKKEGKILIC